MGERNNNDGEIDGKMRVEEEMRKGELEGCSRKMKYDFTSIIDRKGKDALAVDILPNMLGPGKKVEVREGLDYIPMWVADMDFKGNHN